MSDGNLISREVILRIAGLTDITTPLYGSGRLHRHSFWQINMVYEGSSLLSLPHQKQILSAGDLLILPPNCNHYIDYGFSSRHRGLSFKFDCPYRQWTAEQQFILIHRSEIEEHLFNAVMELCLAFMPQVIEAPNRQFSISHAGFRQILLEEMLSGILHYYLEKFSNTTSGGDFLFRMREFISRRSGSPVSVSELAEETGYSEGHLRMLVKSKTRMNLKEFIDRERLAVICNYLCCSSLNLNELSAKFGFCHEIYFNQFFRKYMHISPLKYRKKYSEQQLAAAEPKSEHIPDQLF